MTPFTTLDTAMRTFIIIRLFVLEVLFLNFWFSH